MEKLYQNIYSYLAYPALIAGARLASPFHRKLREGFRIHKNALARWKEKAGTLDPQNPRLWFHATSTGEFEAARPVIDLVRERLGENVSIIFSYYSPSVHKAATSYAAADICEILPLDTKRCVRRVLDWVRPTAIIFVRYDTWPNLIWEASSRGVKLALIAALLRKGSFRIASGFGRALSRVLYSRFDYVGAAAQPDMERLRGICGPRTQVKMTGDSRLDRVKSRKERSQELRIPRSLRPQGDHILVCGSTWPNDEEFIVPAIRRAIAQGLRFRTIIAPHEPTRRHVESLENRLSAAGLASVRYSDVVSGDAPREIVILDSVGFLAEFYQVGTCAYIGGGFLHSGVHNTMEPAIMGLPLMFGPRIENAPEAEAMVRLGAARVIRTPEEILQQITLWVQHPQVRMQQGAQARTFIENNLGASQRYCEDLLGLIQ